MHGQNASGVFDVVLVVAAVFSTLGSHDQYQPCFSFRLTNTIVLQIRIQFFGLLAEAC